MSIDLPCYCSEPIDVVSKSLDSLRQIRIDLFVNNHILPDPRSLSDFTPWAESRKITALEFGIAAQSFVFVSINKESAEQVQEVADAIYDSLGPSKVVVTFQNDHVIPHSSGAKV